MITTNACSRCEGPVEEDQEGRTICMMCGRDPSTIARKPTDDDIAEIMRENRMRSGAKKRAGYI